MEKQFIELSNSDEGVLVNRNSIIYVQQDDGDISLILIEERFDLSFRDETSANHAIRAIKEGRDYAEV